jgi:hypothetical protein
LVEAEAVWQQRQQQKRQLKQQWRLQQPQQQQREGATSSSLACSTTCGAITFFPRFIILHFIRCGNPCQHVGLLTA